ncbi:hypothetical protein B7R74_00050 [Yersinia pseudotuberculosis]|nr:hypothetical protein B7R74_00050 [Yersinia pseudotuberculosis]
MRNAGEQKYSSFRHPSLTPLSSKTASITVRKLTGYQHDNSPPARLLFLFMSLSWTKSGSPW